MTNQQIILGSLSMDLKRAALALHKGSYETGERFSKEAIKRIDELKIGKLDAYIQNLILKTQETLAQNNKDQTPDDLLMYSTLIQNIAAPTK